MKKSWIQEKFIEYAKINTRSDPKSQTIPTTRSQVDFCLLLKRDLEMIGLKEVQYNEENGFLTATLLANTHRSIPTIGFIAHVDTADYSAENIQPKVTENYKGGTIILNGKQQIVLSPDEFPNLKNYIGQTLITTDGTTLLGADDKAGIVEILAAMDWLIQHPEVEHGEIRLAFGPDEEIGVGADYFDAPNFRAAFAYTMDSGTIGHMEYETFNAAQAQITIKGTSVHPGTAKNQMVNALKLAQRVDQLLPPQEVPECTEGYEGFYLLHQLEGTIAQAKMVYIIRDHHRDRFEARKQRLTEIVEFINHQLDYPRLTMTMHDQYYNMKEVIEKDFYPVELAQEAMNQLGITPIVTPFRGGTDGSKISFMGIPTPNLFTGGENFHGQYEFIATEAMVAAAELIVKIVELHTEKQK